MKGFMKQIAYISATILLISMTACDKPPSVQTLMEEGASQFADGKKEEDYTPANSGAALKSMLDDYAGSYGKPSSTQMTDDEFKKHQSQSDSTEPSEGEAITAEVITISDEDDLLRAFHDVYDATGTYLEFKAENGVVLDGEKLQDIYTTLQREDPIDVSGVKEWTWGCQGDVYIITFTYDFPVDELIRIKKDTRQLVKDATANIDTENKTEYEIVYAVNEYLCDTVDYPASEPYEPVTHTAYGALKNGIAVCEGYACAVKLLLNEFSVVCDIQVGDCVEGGGHAWNLVQVDGEWYQMDVTWNDGSSSRTDYFLVTDDYMKKSRTWDEADYPTTPSIAYTP